MKLNRKLFSSCRWSNLKLKRHKWWMK